MNLGQAVKMAAKSISSNKGRSALTMLGIIIGLAAVIILVSYAKGQNMAMAAYYESMGTNQISVYASTWGNSGAVDVGQELYDYCLNLDGVLGISPNGSVWDRPTIKYESKTLSRESSRSYAGGGVSVTSYNNSDDYPRIYLGNDKFGLCSGYTISKGRDLSYLDIEMCIRDRFQKRTGPLPSRCRTPPDAWSRVWPRRRTGRRQWRRRCRGRRLR